MSCSPPQEYQETQKKREEQQLALEKERREQDRLEQLKKKDVRQQSAVASTEVKQRLQVRSLGVLCWLTG